MELKYNSQEQVSEREIEGPVFQSVYQCLIHFAITTLNPFITVLSTWFLAITIITIAILAEKIFPQEQQPCKYVKKDGITRSSTTE